jgi:hypothetical protein
MLTLGLFQIEVLPIKQGFDTPEDSILPNTNHKALSPFVLQKVVACS